MSTNATTGDKPNDGRNSDESITETAATAPHPLRAEIAKCAPYAANHGDSL